MSNEDRVLLRLLRGPALRSELLELTRHCSDCIEILNRRIVGRRIVASWTDITTRLGLHVKVRRYELVKVAA